MKRIFSMIIVFIMCFLMMTSLSFAAPETIGINIVAVVKTKSAAPYSAGKRN